LADEIQKWRKFNSGVNRDIS